MLFAESNPKFFFLKIVYTCIMSLTNKNNVVSYFGSIIACKLFITFMNNTGGVSAALFPPKKYYLRIWVKNFSYEWLE